MDDTSIPIRTTPLFEAHQTCKAKMMTFSGWKMPAFYESPMAEHRAVREDVGIFDVSHMGEIFVSGRDSLAYLQHVLINDVSKLIIGQGHYTALLNEKGGFVDDLLCYRIGEESYLLCVNANNADKDFAWMQAHVPAALSQVTLDNQSVAWSQLAIQGPKSPAVMTDLFPDRPDLLLLPYAGIAAATYKGTAVYVARTGYTGERGYELYLPNGVAVALWEQALATSPTTNIRPIGLGARDTLRLEACFLLYGNDMDDGVTPLEAGVQWAVKLDKGDFIGRAALLQQKECGIPRQLYAFRMEEAGIPRSHMSVMRQGESIGQVTSGSHLPTLGFGGGLALLQSDVQVGDAIEVDVRGTLKAARIVKKPFYQAKTKG